MPSPLSIEEGSLASRSQPGSDAQDALPPASEPSGAHTPGPWRAGEVWRPKIGNLPQGETNAAGENFWGYAIHGRDERGAEILPTLGAVHNFPDAIHANARLIAAAPTMLSALQRISAATMASTNSGTLAEYQSWVRAVADTAIADTADRQPQIPGGQP